MEKIGGVIFATAILIVIALLSFWIVMEAKAHHGGRHVLVSEYCYEKEHFDALLVAEKKGPEALMAARRGMFEAGSCKKIPGMAEGAALYESELIRGTLCDWVVLQLRIDLEPLPVWAAAPRNCGSGI